MCLLQNSTSKLNEFPQSSITHISSHISRRVKQLSRNSSVRRWGKHKNGLNIQQSSYLDESILTMLPAFF
ncbi:MAG: hypothetical protein IJA19_01155 [Clostridia bacterium]|nr:hypothetical protein [Clostridia bacterium]